MTFPFLSARVEKTYDPTRGAIYPAKIARFEQIA